MLTNLARILMNLIAKRGLLKYPLGHAVFNKLYSFRIRMGEWR